MPFGSNVGGESSYCLNHEWMGRSRQVQYVGITLYVSKANRRYYRRLKLRRGKSLLEVYKVYKINAEMYSYNSNTLGVAVFLSRSLGPRPVFHNGPWDSSTKRVTWNTSSKHGQFSQGPGSCQYLGKYQKRETAQQAKTWSEFRRDFWKVR